MTDSRLPIYFADQVIGTSTYNATAHKKRADGTTFSVEAVEVTLSGEVIRASGFWSPLSGTAEFEEAWEASQFDEVTDIHIDRDGAAEYRRITSLNI